MMIHEDKKWLMIFDIDDVTNMAQHVASADRSHKEEKKNFLSFIMQGIINVLWNPALYVIPNQEVHCCSIVILTFLHCNKQHIICVSYHIIPILYLNAYLLLSLNYTNLFFYQIFIYFSIMLIINTSFLLFIMEMFVNVSLLYVMI